MPEPSPARATTTAPARRPERYARFPALASPAPAAGSFITHHTRPVRHLVSFLVPADDVGADPAALGDLQSSRPGPGPHGRAIGRWAARAAGGTAPAAGRRFPAGLD